MKTGSVRRFKRYPITYRWVSSWLLDIHLDGWPLHFRPKWFKSMLIHSFWQNSRPQSPKTALLGAIIQIERALFVSFYSISTQGKATFGQSEIRRDVLYTLLHCNTRKECFWSRTTCKTIICVYSISPLKGTARHLQLTAISQLSKRWHL